MAPREQSENRKRPRALLSFKVPLEVHLARSLFFLPPLPRMHAAFTGPSYCPGWGVGSLMVFYCDTRVRVLVRA